MDTSAAPTSNPHKEQKTKSETGKEKLVSSGTLRPVFCHCESLRSSLSPLLHLTQLAAVDQGDTFFRAIVPPGLEDYLDHCKLSGDILTTLNMVREGQGTFLFRSPVLVKRSKRVECVQESEAMEQFLSFLEAAGGNIILVCVDEDTVGVLMEKLNNVDRGKFRGLVVGYSWWRQVLNHINFPNYKTLELEEYSAVNLLATSNQRKMTSKHVAQVLKRAVRKVAGVEEGLQLSGQLLRLVSVSSKLKALKFSRPVTTGPEVLEFINSFTPDIPAMLKVKRLEQMELESDNGEYVEDDEVKPEPKEPTFETIEIESESESDSESVSMSFEAYLARDIRLSTPLSRPKPTQALPAPQVSQQRSLPKQSNGWKLGRKIQMCCRSLLCPNCDEDILMETAERMEEHMERHITLLGNSLNKDTLKNIGISKKHLCLLCHREVCALDIGEHMMSAHRQRVLFPKGGWEDILSAPRTEPLTQYWSFKRKAKSGKIMILCPGSQPTETLQSYNDQLFNETICKNVWVNMKNLENHLINVHTKSLEKLIEGRGCEGCKTTFPVTSIHLHINCMTQRSSDKQQNTTNSVEKSLTKSTTNLGLGRPGLDSKISSLNSKNLKQMLSLPPPPPPASTSIPNTSQHPNQPVKKGGQTLCAERSPSGQGGTSEGSPRKRVKTGGVQLPYYDSITKVPSSQPCHAKPHHW